jgi:hypothetical protein
MQIDIDFEVYKVLTALRESESDSYNAVVRRVLGLSASAQGAEAQSLNALLGSAYARGAETLREQKRKNSFAAASTPDHGCSDIIKNALQLYGSGAWFGNVHFPDGTKFRATYKGESYSAEIRDRKWIDQHGIERNSPSDAASAITGNNVNCWRFWYVQMPGAPTWQKLEELKQ